MAADLHDSRQERRKLCVTNIDRNIFVIMRYGKCADFEIIEKTIAETVKRFGLTPLIARHQDFDDPIRTTLIYDALATQHEIEEFEYLFDDTVKHFRRRKCVTSPGKELYGELRRAVVKELRECKEKLVGRLETPGGVKS